MATIDLPNPDSPVYASSALSAPLNEVSQEVEAAVVTPLSLLNGFTYKVYWGRWHGQHVLSLYWGVVTPQSHVFVSISEGGIGAARFTVHNVVALSGRIDFWVNIEWDSDINLYVDFLVINQ